MEDDSLEHCIEECNNIHYKKARRILNGSKTIELIKSVNSDDEQDLQRNLMNWIKVAPLLHMTQNNRS